MTAYLSINCDLTQPQVLHEAKDFALLYKPPGMAVQADPRGDLDLLGWYDGDASVVGRLDRPVCGMVLVATTSVGRTTLQTAQSQQKIIKLYRARMVPTAPKLPALLEHGWRFERGLAQTTQLGAKRSKSMRTKVIAQGAEYAELQLITGRRHQLRTQLAAAGCPIVGDRRYGGVQADRVYLSCIAIRLPDGPFYRLTDESLHALNLAT